MVMISIKVNNKQNPLVNILIKTKCHATVKKKKKVYSSKFY